MLLQKFFYLSLFILLLTSQSYSQLQVIGIDDVYVSDIRISGLRDLKSISNESIKGLTLLAAFGYIPLNFNIVYQIPYNSRGKLTRFNVNLSNGYNSIDISLSGEVIVNYPHQRNKITVSLNAMNFISDMGSILNMALAIATFGGYTSGVTMTADYEFVDYNGNIIASEYKTFK